MCEISCQKSASPNHVQDEAFGKIVEVCNLRFTPRPSRSHGTVEVSQDVAQRRGSERRLWVTAFFCFEGCSIRG